ncbi:hypothetical protein SDC9_73037 [bioreactor metagenome]|uniref:Aminoglycoside N(3)-acetyltransferase n=1 Tax=bioreactor metagenome TaxID=1076179 RepID=A0A644YJ60_9ZZZZ|nr:AAC(3) family N-acetyltransferase [Oscillospiraceae bacterium]
MYKSNSGCGNAVSKSKMKRAFAAAGIVPGDTLLMHGALSAIGYAENGADDVIDALMELIGTEGTLAVVAMSGNQPFDAATSPSSVGILTETLRLRPGAYRSLRPVHSIAAIGKRAKELTEDHDKAQTNCGEGTPYTKLRDMHGKIILLGVDMNRNTTLHSVEDICDCSYLEERTMLMPTYYPDYEGKTITVRKFPPGHRDFLKLVPVLRRAGAVKETVVGKACVKVIDAAMMFDIAVKAVSEDEMFFMCDNPACQYCSAARKAAKNV